MWRKTLLIVMVLSVLTVPGFAQGSAATIGECTEQTPVGSAVGEPFGSLEGLRFTGGNVATGTAPLIGWSLASGGVAWVDIVVDGEIIGRAQFGKLRQDVAAVFPGFPDGAFGGFEFNLDTTRYLNGSHQVQAMMVSNTGQVGYSNTFALDFNNVAHNLVPFGIIDNPRQNARVFGICDPTDPVRRYTVVSGWTLDAGTGNNDHGVAYVELLLDGARIRSSRISCHHSTVTGLFTDCYGLQRDELETLYPHLKDAPRGGFRFVIDVGALMNVGYTPGKHTLSVRVGDHDNQVVDVDSIDVDFFCDDARTNSGSFGGIDNAPERKNSNMTEISGWALDFEGVESVQVFVDGEFAGTAVYGFPRDGIASMYPGFPDSAASGWIYSLNTLGLSDGRHSIQAMVIDIFDVVTLIGEIEFDVQNP